MDKLQNRPEDWMEWEEAEDARALAQQAACPICFAHVPLADSAAENVASVVLAHVAAVHGADLLAVRRAERLDDYGWIRLVNALRRRDSPAAGAFDAAQFAADRRAELRNSDALLLPALPNDPLLSLLGDDDDDEEADDEEMPGLIGEEEEEEEEKDAKDWQIEALKQRVAQLESLAQRLLVGDAAEESDDMPMLVEKKKEKRDEDEDLVAELTTDNYFDSYGMIGIHEIMLGDKVRTCAYERFFKEYAKTGLLEGKTVMDVGAGTGILSMFAAREGAGKVFAVEASGTAALARNIIDMNGYSDKIQLLNCLVESAEAKKALGDEKRVDLIVSEWMGYALLFENMLESVIFARDHWLKPGGMMQPSHALMYLSAANNEKLYRERVDLFSDKFYGIDLSLLKRPALEQVSVEVLDPKTLVSEPFMFHEIDILTVQRNSYADRTLPFAFTTTADASGIFCLCLHFDTDFRHPGGKNVLSTSPREPPTHWKQAVFYLMDPVPACPAGTLLDGTLRFVMTSAGPHDLDIHLSFSAYQPGVTPTTGQPFHTTAQLFHI